MTYLEKYLQDHNCTEKDFKEKQEEYGGFCPDDIGIVDSCPDGVDNCELCWSRKINI